MQMFVLVDEEVCVWTRPYMGLSEEIRGRVVEDYDGRIVLKTEDGYVLLPMHSIHKIVVKRS